MEPERNVSEALFGEATRHMEEMDGPFRSPLNHATRLAIPDH